jgi:predicted amidohydrolase YtcJ
MVPFAADTVFINGQVITMDSKNTIAEAVAVYGNKITFVGSTHDAQKWIGTNTKVVDAGKKSVLPGFIDAHLHSGSVGMALAGVDCSIRQCKSIEDIKKAIGNATSRYPKGSLIRGYNYDNMQLAEQRHPTKWDLDEAAPDHMVVIGHTSFHFSVCNSKALAAAGIANDTPDPPGGVFLREKGEVNGVAMENANWQIFAAFPVSEEEMAKGLLAADAFFAGYGITSVHDAGDGTTMLKTMVDLKRENRFKTRFYAMLFSMYEKFEFLERYYNIGFHTGFGSDSYKIGPHKLMLDGSSMGGTCALRAPYTIDPNRKGILTMDQETLNKYMVKGHLNGYQLTCHAIGDLAVEMVLNAYDEVFSKYPVKNARPRIEHCFITDEDLIERMRKLEVIPVAQPEFIYSSGDTYKRLYGDRVNYAFAARSFLDAGIPVAFSSDCPVTVPNPYAGLYGACLRKSTTGQSIGEQQRVSLLDALRMFTYNGAYASFEEDIKGSLETGKLADIIIASEPLLDIPLESLLDASTVMTMVNGEITYEKSRG